ncbi:MAG TPA: HAD-IIIC family phosphatase [Bdellovibrionota bacterium]|nr:HAD-IIIC family phosphatase [Bdellovibrionota bacterium]
MIGSEEFKSGLKEVQRLLKESRHREAFAKLRTLADPGLEFPVQQRLAKVYRSIDAEHLNLRPISIAILPTSTVDQFVDVFCFWLALNGYRGQFFVGAYDTLHQTVLDPCSDLYAFNPAVVWLFTNHRDVRLEISSGTSIDGIRREIDQAVEASVAIWDALKRNSSAFIIQNNADLPLSRSFGNYESSVLWSRANALREYNLCLARSLVSGVSVFDLEFASAIYGKNRWFDERYWYHSKHAFSFDAIGHVAFSGARLIQAIKGASKKVLVLDLDNTLWGGVIGDDGVSGIRLGTGADGEAFVAFQRYLKQLKNRGIVLAVCSKNEPDAARLPFQNHPDMVLRLDDIAVFRANWDNKADNIRHIAQVLELGLDSFVFVDDNPVERDLVRRMVPEVTVPELPEDPALYIRALDRELLFETVTFSQEDGARNQMYRDNAERKAFQTKFSNISEFLESLEMEACVGHVDQLNLPRMAQLINKSNQFHLTGNRYSEADIQALSKDPNVVCRFFKMRDRFGDNGLISVVILRKSGVDVLVDTWVMSCRVLSRGMEEFVNNEIILSAKNLGAERIIGVFVPTKKNTLVAGLYERLGYSMLDQSPSSTRWVLTLSPDLKMRDTSIRQIPVY